VDNIKEISQQLFEKLQVTRLQARNLIRGMLKNEAEEDTSKTQMRSNVKRGALTGLESYIQTVKPQGKKKGPEKKIIKVDTKALEEEGTADKLEDADGEYWSNSGAEFQAEKIVRQYLPFFRHSLFGSLEPHQLRELLRVVAIQDTKNGDVIFKENDLIHGVYVLKYGTIVCRGNNMRPLTVSLEEEVDPTSDSGANQRHSHVEVLDLQAFRDPGNKKHTCTAEVTSEKAQVLVFERKMALEAGHDPRLLVTEGIKKQMLQRSHILRLAFPHEIFTQVARLLVYNECDAGFRFLSQGEMNTQIYIVEKGQLRLTDERKTKVINVGQDKVTCGKGETWQPFMIFGARQILLHSGSPMHVEVNSGKAQVWTLDEKHVNGVLTSGNLVRALEIGASVLYLTRLTLFKNMKPTDHRLRDVVLHSEMCYNLRDDDIIEQGDEGDCLYMLIDGTVGILVSQRDTMVEVSKLTADVDQSKVHFFGEVSVLESSRRAATVRVRSAAATTLRVDVHSINTVFGSVEQLLACQGLEAAHVIIETKNRIRGKADDDPSNTRITDKAPTKSMCAGPEDYDPGRRGPNKPASAFSSAAAFASTKVGRRTMTDMQKNLVSSSKSAASRVKRLSMSLGLSKSNGYVGT